MDFLGLYERVSSWFADNERNLKIHGMRFMALMSFVVGIVYLFKFLGGVFG